MGGEVKETRYDVHPGKRLLRVSSLRRCCGLDLRGICTTLVLDLELLFLEAPGQEVALVPVTLDLTAVPHTERLLRTALCADTSSGVKPSGHGRRE